MADLGAGFAGVVQLPPDTPEAEILALDAAGIRVVRFNVPHASTGRGKD